MARSSPTVNGLRLSLVSVPGLLELLDVPADAQEPLPGVFGIELFLPDALKLFPESFGHLFERCQVGSTEGLLRGRGLGRGLDSGVLGADA